MRKLLLAIVVLLLTSCTSISLDEKWWPLRYIKQSKILAFGAGARTIGDSMYVSNIDNWIATHPEPLYSATVAHERVHSIRQKYYPGGRGLWITRYLHDLKFMYYEEQLGYYVHIRYALAKGARINVDKMADRMSEYFGVKGPLFPMVSKEDAAEWIVNVINGAWRPPTDVLEQIRPPF